ncbi:MAG: hypothetical protein AABZ53_04010 [Planctomycetota bacterium]
MSDPHTTAHGTDTHHGSAHVDNWHHHAPDEGLPQEEHGGHINASVMGRGLALIIFSTAGLIIVTALYFNHEMGVKYRERTDISLAEGHDKYKAEAQAKLKSYGWADDKATLVRIPIEEGKKRVIKSYAQTAPK